jgi:hypothetical protein
LVGVAATVAVAGFVGVMATVAVAGFVGVMATVAVAAGLPAVGEGATAVALDVVGAVGLLGIAGVAADPACAGAVAGFGAAAGAGGGVEAEGAGSGAAAATGAGSGDAGAGVTGAGAGAGGGTGLSAVGAASVCDSGGIPAQPAHARTNRVAAIRNARVTRQFSRGQRRGSRIRIRRTRDCPVATCSEFSTARFRGNVFWGRRDVSHKRSAYA